MCTVTFFPLADQSILITSNRDESADRNAQDVERRDFSNGATLYYPQDSLHGGTWFGASDDGSVSCILNGAYEPYDRSVAYPGSRGSLPFALVESGSVDRFVEDFDFGSVAPFTMVIYHKGELHQLKYNGEKPDRQLLDPQIPHIWSSVTLYPEPVRKARQRAFDTFVGTHPHPDRQQLVAFHSSQPFGDGSNDFIMNRRGIVQTVSITQAYYHGQTLELLHKDLIEGRLWEKEIKREFD